MLQPEVKRSSVAIADPFLSQSLLSHYQTSFNILRGLRELLPVLPKEACKLEPLDLPLAEEDANESELQSFVFEGKKE